MKRSDTTIKTNRLFLRQINETDAEAIVSLRSDENVYQYFLNPVKLTVEEHLKWYKEQYVNDDGRIDWIAVDNENRAFIGVYGAKNVDEDTVEISYLTNPEHTNKGFASEAVNAILSWVVSNQKASKAIVTIHSENKASLSFAESLGFVKSQKKGAFINMDKMLSSHQMTE